MTHRSFALGLSLLGLSAPAFAQPYPAGPALVTNAAVPDGGVAADDVGAVVYDTTHDSDPDIDGYDAQSDVYYDNVAAQGYDDGYDPAAYSKFQSALDPYGSWVTDPTYGRVWAPSTSVVGADFFPYATGGRWVLTEYGWTWVSDWDWGWAPFHYGRWITLASHGWCWIPGSIWGPAWVSWRYGGGYAGWTPLPPAGVRVGAPTGVSVGAPTGVRPAGPIVVGPPPGVRPSWKFVLAGQLGVRSPSYLPARTIPAIFGRTSVVSNLRTVTLGTSTVRVNAGPTSIPSGTGFGTSTPATLRSVAPRMLPQSTIVPRTGIPIGSRPWAGVGTPPSIQQTPRPISIPIGPRGGDRPMYSPPPRPYAVPQYSAPRPGFYVTPSQPPPYQATPPRPLPYGGSTYAPPAYQGRPPSVYTAPPTYSPPINRGFQTPAPTYAPPPRPFYQAPAYSPPPSFNGRSSMPAPAPMPSRSVGAPFGRGSVR